MLNRPSTFGKNYLRVLCVFTFAPSAFKAFALPCTSTHYSLFPQNLSTFPAHAPNAHSPSPGTRASRQSPQDRARTTALAHAAHHAPAAHAPAVADASSPPGESAEHLAAAQTRSALQSSTARPPAPPSPADSPAAAASSRPAPRTPLPRPRLTPHFAPRTYSSIFFTCCAHPPSFILKASARRASGTFSKPLSVTVTSVPFAIGSSRNSTSVGSSFE